MCEKDCEKRVVIDGTGHIAGRLGSIVAKKLLEGYQVTILCAESIVLTGPIHRSKGKYEDFLNKGCVYNPRKGPYHYHEPSKYFTRILKRMLPHKKHRGAIALGNLTVYEGIPNGFEFVTKSVCPQALAEYKSNPIRKSTTLGLLLENYGWKYSKVTEEFKTRALNKEKMFLAAQSSKAELTKKEIASTSFKNEVNDILSTME